MQSKIGYTNFILFVFLINFSAAHPAQASNKAVKGFHNVWKLPQMSRLNFHAKIDINSVCSEIFTNLKSSKIGSKILKTCETFLAKFIESGLID